MSYEIVKGIKHRKKDNKIFITSASNNVWPRDYNTWEFMAGGENKELYLFQNIIGNSLQLSNSVSENWKYAENRFRNYCYENNINTYDLWELPYSDNKGILALKLYYDIFKNYYDEKIEGKYYLKCSLGNIVKVNDNSFAYVLEYIDNYEHCKSYKKIYNDYCRISDECKEKYNIAISKYELEKDVAVKENNYDVDRGL